MLDAQNFYFGDADGHAREGAEGRDTISFLLL
jgi:hypothetical protein